MQLSLKKSPSKTTYQTRSQDRIKLLVKGGGGEVVGKAVLVGVR